MFSLLPVLFIEESYLNHDNPVVSLKESNLRLDEAIQQAHPYSNAGILFLFVI